jgi:hypothetical protein
VFINNFVRSVSAHRSDASRLQGMGDLNTDLPHNRRSERTRSLIVAMLVSIVLSCAALFLALRFVEELL